MLKSIVRISLKLLFRVRVEGQYPQPMPERLIVIANHQSFLDAMLLWAFLPMDAVWVVHTQIWSRWYFRPIVRMARHVVVDTANPMAIKTLVHLIEAGESVAVFPEGRITVTGGLMKMYDGPAFMAAKTGAALLPIAIDGAIHSLLSRMAPPFPRKMFPRIRLTVMPLAYIEMPETGTGKQRRRITSQKMQQVMEDLRFRAHPIKTLHEAFLDAVELHGRGTCILDDVRQDKQTFGHLLKASLALGRLVGRLTSEGEIVGVLMPNSGTTVALLMGMFASRRVPAMLNYSLGVDGVQSACESACIKTVLTARAFVEKARLTEKVNQLQNVRIVYLEDLRPQFSLSDKLWLLFRALPNPRAVMRGFDPKHAAVVLFTSGSEGKPKGVVLSHAAIMANAAQVKSFIAFSRQDRFLNALPMFHAFGLVAGVLIPITTGCNVYLYPSPLHYRMIPEVTYDFDCNILFGTPAFLANYARVAHPYDFARLRFVVAGAERLPNEVRQTWLDKFGVRVLEGYGATECAPIIAANSEISSQAGSVGRLMPGMDYRIEPVPGIDRGGELHVSGPNLMLGYLKHDQPGVLQPPSSIYGSGWYNTGDVVEIDEQGFIYITGRLKRFAKVAGEMVSLEVAEKIAAAASPGHRHAASTKSSAHRGEMIILFTQDPALGRDRLLAAARSLGLPELAVARRVEHLGKIPVLGSGKSDYVQLKEMAERLV